MKERIDTLLLKKDLVKSRNQAQALIQAGKVIVDGKVITKNNALIDDQAEIIVSEAMKYVGRGGFKLEKALEHFDIDVKNIVAVDIGSSTGGFTDCLLQQGAAKVYAIDVGTDQLDQRLRTNAKVIVMEKTDIRNVDLPELADLTVIDVSFISLVHILPEAVRLTKPTGNIIALIKPQFEVGPENIGKNGIVKYETAKEEAIAKIITTAEELGLTSSPVIESPIKGGDGNTEYLVWFTK